MNKQNKHRRLGICFLLEDFYPIIHGATTQILLIGERLIKSGINVTIITRKIQSDHSSHEIVKGMNVIRVKPAIGVKRIGKYVMLAPAYISLLKERKRYDIIIVSDLKVLGILGVLSAKHLNKICILRAESCGEMDGSFITQYGNQTSGLKALIINFLLYIRNKILIRADIFLSISSVITREFLQSGIPKNSLVEITNGIDTEKYYPVDYEEKLKLKKKLGLTDKKHFIFTGRLTRGKGLEYLLRVWKRLTSDFRGIQLVLIGSGQGYSLSCEEELKTFVKENNLEQTVLFTGNVYNVNEYLQACDYFVFPSQSEALGLSLVEALSCGLPSIATDVGGILDIIENNVNGILVPYCVEDQLYESMKNFLENERKAIKLGLEGRKTVVERFGIDQIIDRYISLFNKQLGER